MALLIVKMTKHFQSSSIFKEFVLHESLKHYQFSILNCSLCLLKDLPNHWIDISFPVLMYTTVQKFGVRNICFWKKLMDALNWWKVTIKTFMLQKISISNKCCSSEPSIHQKKSIKITSENLEQQIRMISEGSCDAENQSNGWRKFSFASKE